MGAWKGVLHGDLRSVSPARFTPESEQDIWVGAYYEEKTLWNYRPKVTFGRTYLSSEQNICTKAAPTQSSFPKSAPLLVQYLLGGRGRPSPKHRKRHVFQNDWNTESVLVQTEIWPSELFLLAPFMAFIFSTTVKYSFPSMQNILL